ncbi:hypothetical protein, conserved [Plasmodium ovale wallikeri]|uniref:Uncharacterized protein n=1 Tax=Plasmodium ovale wallikeri TaxID=864142 RepID=A0A1A8Z094_PLAOA|nr:hypothetical protein, conserved [Plasmodium ovale wallikeri]SBT37267.1 hypothetical protein, conserved [Plasmodium ovale wallikeri]
MEDKLKAFGSNLEEKVSVIDKDTLPVFEDEESLKTSFPKLFKDADSYVRRLFKKYFSGNDEETDLDDSKGDKEDEEKKNEKKSFLDSLKHSFQENVDTRGLVLMIPVPILTGEGHQQYGNTGCPCKDKAEKGSSGAHQGECACQKAHREAVAEVEKHSNTE